MAQPKSPPHGTVYGLSLAVGSLNLSRLGRLRSLAAPGDGLAPGGRPTRLQPQVREDLLDHRRLQGRRDDLELATAVRAVRQVEFESANFSED